MGAIQITENKHLNDPEIDYFLALLKRHKNERDSIMLRIALYTGARGCELLQIRVKDFSKGSVTVKGAKGSNDRTLPLTSDDYLFPLEIQNYIKTNSLKADDRLFPITTRMFRKIFAIWRPNPNKGAHSLRHTVGVKLFNSCENIHIVKTVLGHKSLTSTQVYLDYVESQRHLKKKMKGFLRRRLDGDIDD